MSRLPGENLRKVIRPPTLKKLKGHMPPTLKKLKGHIALGLSVHPLIHSKFKIKFLFFFLVIAFAFF